MLPEFNLTCIALTFLALFSLAAHENDGTADYIEHTQEYDAATLKELSSIKTPAPTDAILYEQKNRMIYVTHDNGADVWVIDPAQGRVTANIMVPGVPEYMVYDEVADRIYLNIKDKDLVAIIEPSSNKVVAQWPTAPASQPHGLALDASNHRIFSSGGNGKLVVIDTKSGAVIGSVGIARKVDQIAFDAVGVSWLPLFLEFSSMAPDRGNITSDGKATR